MRPALLIIDMINLFDFEGGNQLGVHALKACGPIATLRQAFADRNWPVLFANDNFMDWNQEFTDLVAKCRQHPGPSGEIAAVLGPKPEEYYVLKPRHSGFLCTTLPAILADLKLQELVITGVATDSCVLATVQDAHMRGYKVRVPQDCVAAQTPSRSTRALALMRESMSLDTRRAKTVLRSLAAEQ